MKESAKQRIAEERKHRRKKRKGPKDLLEGASLTQIVIMAWDKLVEEYRAALEAATGGGPISSDQREVIEVLKEVEALSRRRGLRFPIDFPVSFNSPAFSQKASLLISKRLLLPRIKTEWAAYQALFPELGTTKRKKRPKLSSTSLFVLFGANLEQSWLTYCRRSLGDARDRELPWNPQN